MPVIPPIWVFFEHNSGSTDLTPEQRKEAVTLIVKSLKSILIIQAHEILMISMGILLLLSVFQILCAVGIPKTPEQQIINSKQLSIIGYSLLATLITYCLISEKSLVSIPIISTLYSLWIQPFKSEFSHIWESNTDSTMYLVFGMYGLFGMYMLASFWKIPVQFIKILRKVPDRESEQFLIGFGVLILMMFSSVH